MQKTFEELKNEFGIESLEGLNDSKVLEQREKYGENALKEKKKQSILVKFLLEFKDALIIILLIAAVVSLIVDPEEWVESLIIFLVVIFNAVLGVYQEGKAEKSLESLKKMSSPTCKVFRNGVLITIPTKELVVVDSIALTEGKTKEMLAVLKGLNIDKTAIFLTANQDEMLLRAAANLQNVDVTTSSLLNVYDIVNADTLVIEEAAVKYIEEVLK